MSPIRCPNCNLVLTSKEVADGWCESCGKKLPQSVSRQAAGGASGASRPEPDTRKPGLTVGGFFVLLLCITVGAVVAVAINKGKADSLWLGLGCGIGAGVGAALAQATGLWIVKKK